MIPANKPPPEQLLHYDSAHSVLICTACGYAMQPTGIARHLKEIHQIYRSHRRPYMEYASRFHLADPKDVTEAKIDEFPVALLPVLDGLRCLGAEKCDYLCVSLKRMQNHWLSIHDRHGSAGSDWRYAPLQTFFKGNLLRYFTKSQTQPTQKETQEVYSAEVYSADLPSQLDSLDHTLFRHYVTTTSLSFVDVHGTQHIWQYVIPQMAREHPFLMHALLASSALHLSQKQPADICYLTRAHEHQDIAMPLFRQAISHITESNCHSILAFCHLLVIYSFAAGRADERLLVADVSSQHPELLSSWLYFIRNGCVLVCDLWDDIEEGPLAPLVSCWDLPIPDLGGATKSRVTNQLLSILRRDEDFVQHAELYRETAALLGLALEAAQAMDGQNFSLWEVIRVWPLQISAAYIELLTSERPAALVLLAHYCLLLDMAQSRWYLENRAKALLEAVLSRLSPEWHRYIFVSFEEVKAYIPLSTFSSTLVMV